MRAFALIVTILVAGCTTPAKVDTLTGTKPSEIIVGPGDDGDVVVLASRTLTSLPVDAAISPQGARAAVVVRTPDRQAPDEILVLDRTLAERWRALVEDREDGRWLPARVTGVSMSDEDYVVVATARGQVHAYRYGQREWSMTVGADSARVATAPGGHVIASSGERVMRITNSGESVWARDVEDDVRLLAAGTLCVATTRGALISIGCSDGVTLARTAWNGTPSRIAATGPRIIFTGSGVAYDVSTLALHAVGPATDAVPWQDRTARIVDGHVVIGEKQSDIDALRLAAASDVLLAWGHGPEVRLLGPG